MNRIKSIVKGIICWINSLFFLGSSVVKSKRTSFYFARINCTSQNKLDFLDSNISNSRLNINGNGHIIELVAVNIKNSQIIVEGVNNRISVANGVHLINSTIVLRGNNCVITIGNGTTFGGIRIVNTGSDNAVSIGNNCLFADNIELWASDTHAIVNEKNEIINKERPVIIGDCVWVGSHVCILKGVVIHDYSIIGMGTIVTKDVPPKTISVGSPNRIVKENVTWKLDYNS